MDGLQALFAELYNRFLLRDFVGKIVPGGVLVFSVLTLLASPKAVLDRLQRLSTPAGVFVCGLTWILTLGVQNLFELSGVWAYFPYQGRLIASYMSERTALLETYQIAQPIDFGQATEQMIQFQAGATEGQRLQYERFVVIKEASGNLFATIALSIPAWVISALGLRQRRDATKWCGPAYVVALGIAVLLGLFRMHWQHVGRQWSYATTITASAARSEIVVPPTECTPKVRTRLKERGYDAVTLDEICER